LKSIQSMLGYRIIGASRKAFSVTVIQVCAKRMARIASYSYIIVVRVALFTETEWCRRGDSNPHELKPTRP
jgi:hypothetical protein